MAPSATLREQCARISGVSIPREMAIAALVAEQAQDMAGFYLRPRLGRRGLERAYLMAHLPDRRRNGRGFRPIPR